MDRGRQIALDNDKSGRNVMPLPERRCNDEQGRLESNPRSPWTTNAVDYVLTFFNAVGG
jgi:hypothetical protein